RRLPIITADDRIKGAAHKLDVLRRHRLPPLLCELLGVCECLIAVGVDGHPCELAVFPHSYDPAFQRKREAGRTTPVAALDGVYDPVAEVLDFVDHNPEFVQGLDPLLVKATNRLWTRVGA